MMENVEDIIASVKVEQVLISVLNTVGEVKVPTNKFFESNGDNYELVMSYDDEGPSFTFSVKNRNEEISN
jgi:hypothetical protein